MGRKIKSITDPKLSLNLFTKEEVQRIHTATLDVIENVGIRFPSARALEIWEAHGADVNHETSVVKVKGEVIEEALKSAPPIYSLAARDPEQDLPMDGNHVFLGTDGCGVEVLDIHSGERRRSLLAGCAGDRTGSRLSGRGSVSLGGSISAGQSSGDARTA